MTTNQIIAVVLIAAVLVVAFIAANRDIDRILLEELTDDEPKPPPPWNKEAMDLHVATAILQPDSEILPAEEAQR